MSNYMPGRTRAVSITRTADTTAYTANDVIGAATGSTAGIQFEHLGTAGGHVRITNSELERDVAAVISGEGNYRLHLYTVTPPSALGDNVAFDLPLGDRASYLGYLDLGTPIDLGSTLYVQAEQAKDVTLGLEGALFGYLVTIGAYTPASASVCKVTLHTVSI